MILRREISWEFIKNEKPEIKEKLVNDILTLFQVRERQDEKDKMKEVWLIFIMDYRLTAPEIFQAHKMALKRELLDDKGQEIECLPMLSTNTTGKILKAYERFKLADKQLENGREKLAEIMNAKPEKTDEEKAAEKLQQIENVKNCVKEFGVCEYGFLVYDEFMKNEDFKFFSKDFPAIYDKHFKKFIAKIQNGNLSIFSIKEIPIKEKNHQDIMNRLIRKIGVKKHELEGIPLQNAKSEIVENYLKQC